MSTHQATLLDFLVLLPDARHALSELLLAELLLGNRTLNAPQSTAIWGRTHSLSTSSLDAFKIDVRLIPLPWRCRIALCYWACGFLWGRVCGGCLLLLVCTGLSLWCLGSCCCLRGWLVCLRCLFWLRVGVGVGDLEAFDVESQGVLGRTLRLVRHRGYHAADLVCAVPRLVDDEREARCGREQDTFESEERVLSGCGPMDDAEMMKSEASCSIYSIALESIALLHRSKFSLPLPPRRRLHDDSSRCSLISARCRSQTSCPSQTSISRTSASLSASTSMSPCRMARSLTPPYVALCSVPEIRPTSCPAYCSSPAHHQVCSGQR